MSARLSFSHLAAILLLPLLASLGSACAKKDAGGQQGAYSGADGDYVTGTPLPDRQEGVSFLGSNVDRDRFSPVYFGFDSIDIPAGEQSKIEEVAAFLKGGGRMIVAGFTDERGTPEYNRGLGERRAGAVRQALIRAGADASEVQTVSFGAEMPAAEGSSESAYARNRRAEFGAVK